MALYETTETLDAVLIAEEISKHHDWKYELQEYQLIITRVGMWGQAYSVSISQAIDCVHFSSSVSLVIKTSSEREIFRLINELNIGFHGAGAVSIDKLNDTIAYRSSLDFCDMRPFTATDIETRIEAHIAVMDRFYPGFATIVGQPFGKKKRVPKALDKAGRTAEEALKLIIYPAGIGRA